MKAKTYFIFILIVSLLGILISSYLTYDHYQNSSYCLAGSSCNKVNQSIYSEIFGIPIAVIGLIGYLSLFILSILVLKNKIKKSRRVFALFFVFSSIALGYSIVLFYISYIILNSLCPYCFVLYALNLFIFIISIIKIRHYAKHREF